MSVSGKRGFPERSTPQHIPYLLEEPAGREFIPRKKRIIKICTKNTKKHRDVSSLVRAHDISRTCREARTGEKGLFFGGIESR